MSKQLSMTPSAIKQRRFREKHGPSKRKEYHARYDAKRQYQSSRRWTVIVSVCKLKNKRQAARNLLNLTKEQFLAWADLESNKTCAYCGTTDLGKGHGVDRLDSSKPYELDNIVACCKLCNQAKNKLTLEEFINHIKKIHDYIQRKTK